ncbi:MAG: UDP-4-amino-4-deoxy-L-arabinose aminotransferase [Spartobacteria bacterium]|nr:UDP-4-amino-4-deoxy-L-arabinose aminotransferase [Spartobacteria bacterium]
MRENFLPFSKPSISEADINAIADVLRSGWITTGPHNAEFERQVCNKTGCAHAVALASATAGMHLLLKALNIGPGDEVITPSMTWVSTPNLITLAGAKAVFVDVDRDTLMTSRKLIESHITERTKLIVPVHFAGAPADMDPIRSLARERGIALAEDAAHAIGTEYKDVPIGKTGTCIFSFHPIKNITTGEGGMFCTDDPALADRIRQLKFHGLGVDAYDRTTHGRAPQAQVIEPGYKYNMTDISAVLGLRQLSRLDAFNQRRMELAIRYRERLEEIDELLPLADPPYPHKHAWHLFIVRVDIDKAGINRDAFMALLKERNVGTGLHFRAAHLQKYYQEAAKMQQESLPATAWNSERICSLPLFPDMTDRDVDDVIEAIKDVLKD